MKYDVNADIYEGPPTEVGYPPKAGGRRECRRPKGAGGRPR